MLDLYRSQKVSFGVILVKTMNIYRNQSLQDLAAYVPDVSNKHQTCRNDLNIIDPEIYYYYRALKLSTLIFSLAGI